MEKLDYKELLNQDAIDNWYWNSFGSILIGCNFYLWSGWWIAVGVIWHIYFLAKIPKGYTEKKRIKNTISHYNDYVELYSFSLVEDKSREEYSDKAKNWISKNYTRIWTLKFVYEDEEQVYKSSKGDVYTVNGYFKDMGGYKDRKVKYSIIFKDGEHYMSNIENLLLLNYEKGTPFLYDRKSIYKESNMWAIWVAVLTIVFILCQYISYK